MKLQRVLRGIAISATLLCCAQARAHFLWLTSVQEDGQAKAVLYFSESAHAQDYHLPESMVDATISQRTSDKRVVELNNLDRVDTEDRVGLETKLEDDGNSILASSCDYGIYGGSLLSYYSKHVRCAKVDQLGAAGRVKHLKLEIVPSVIEGKVELTVLWEGKPKAKVELSVTEANEEMHELKTDAEGRAYYRPTSTGLVGVRAGFTDRSVKGELDGKKYAGAAHYATLTFQLPSIEQFEQAKEQPSEPVAEESTLGQFVPLPEGLASFGAAVHDGWLYVYSGHIGGAHDHSRENLSQRFQRLNLAGGQSWEELPMQSPLQGLALVSHQSGLYRIGGMNARNSKEEDEDLHSTTEFAHFDPSTKKWTRLASMPEARSSHDAVVIGDKIYVAGGWTLSGESDGTWLNSALVFDLAKPSRPWMPLPQAPFQRRALAVSHWQGKLVVMGGLDSEGDISFQTDLYDPDSQTWSEGPKLPGQGMEGFGASAWNLGDELYFSGLEGQVYKLNADGQRWNEVTTMETPRFFHQLLPFNASSLIAVAGASRSGHLSLMERLMVDNNNSR